MKVFVVFIALTILALDFLGFGDFLEALY